MKTKLLIAAFAILLQRSAMAGFAEGLSVPPVEVSEDQGSVRLRFSRDPDDGTNSLQTIAYSTSDLTARAGIDYVAAAGALTFAIGQVEASFVVWLIDNPIADGPRSLRIDLPNLPRNIHAWSPGIATDSSTVVIRDNEFPDTVVDDAFVPERAPAGELAANDQWIWLMPDRRVLIKGGIGGMTMLNESGLIDGAFKVATAGVASLEPLHVFPDGTILAREWGQTVNRFLRLHSDGSLSGFLAAPACCGGSGKSYSFAGAFVDGRLLMWTEESWPERRLRRMYPDGTEDMSFYPPDNVERLLSIAPDGKLLVELGAQDRTGTHLARLHSDGSIDNSFLAAFGPYESYHYVSSTLLRANGKIVITGAFGGPLELPSGHLVQLNSDGSLDAAFDIKGTSSELEAVLETADQRLLVLELGLTVAHTSLRRVNVDGTFDPTFNAIFHTPIRMSRWPKVIPANSGTVLASGPFNEVDGVPRRRLVRLRTDSPRREFRVRAPECEQSVGVARLKVVRTGDVTTGASVDYSTHDGTAIAGRDYMAQTGTLTFAPGQASREVAIPLAVAPTLTQPLRFTLELRQPSAGYSFSPATTVLVWPPLRITELHRKLRTDGLLMIELNCDGLIPGLGYTVEGSDDILFKNGYEEALSASSTTHRYQRLLPNDSAQYFRIRRD